MQKHKRRRRARVSSSQKLLAKAMKLQLPDWYYLLLFWTILMSCLSFFLHSHHNHCRIFGGVCTGKGEKWKDPAQKQGFARQRTKERAESRNQYVWKASRWSALTVLHSWAWLTVSPRGSPAVYRALTWIPVPLGTRWIPFSLWGIEALWNVWLSSLWPLRLFGLGPHPPSHIFPRSSWGLMVTADEGSWDGEPAPHFTRFFTLWRRAPKGTGLSDV